MSLSFGVCTLDVLQREFREIKNFVTTNIPESSLFTSYLYVLWSCSVPCCNEIFFFCKTLQDYREAESWREAKNSHWANLPCSSLTSSDRSYSFPPLGLLTSYFFLPAIFSLLSKSYSIFSSPPDCHIFTLITPCTLALEDKSH